MLNLLQRYNSVKICYVTIVTIKYEKSHYIFNEVKNYFIKLICSSKQNEDEKELMKSDSFGEKPLFQTSITIC